MYLLFRRFILLLVALAPAVGAAVPAGGQGVVPAVWHPALHTTWQWQLTGTINQTVAATMYDIDMFDNTAQTVAQLHAAGRKVVCYISAGTWENWRPDARQFPAAVLGAADDGWPGERWLDIRQIGVLAPIMSARLNLCRARGFDAVEPDNVDGYTNDTGFPLTAQNQITYNRWFAAQAHAHGLSVGLKNDSDQVAALLPDFDWALIEDCYAQDWCSQLTPFVQAGKAVFAAEYTDTGVQPAQFCPRFARLHFNGIFKHRALDSWRVGCP